MRAPPSERARLNKLTLLLWNRLGDPMISNEQRAHVKAAYEAVVLRRARADQQAA